MKPLIYIVKDEDWDDDSGIEGLSKKVIESFRTEHVPVKGDRIMLKKSGLVEIKYTIFDYISQQDGDGDTVIYAFFLEKKKLLGAFFSKK